LRLADNEAWEKKGYRVSLLVEPGRLRLNSQTRLYGVPYGARARMILLYLQTEAIRSNSREVELGRSMRAWLERMGLSVGGETAKALREQAACPLWLRNLQNRGCGRADGITTRLGGIRLWPTHTAGIEFY
jgi:hypothetical protein